MDDAALAAAVAVALGDGALVEEAHRDGIDYDAFLAHRAVHRIRGTARVAGDRVAWSLVEKVTEGPAFASPYLRDNAERELAAYTSGLLDALAPRIRAPRAYGAREDPHGRITLWLEDVPQPPRPLGADALLTAAHDLGGLAARWAGRVPTEPWLFRGWIDRHGQPGAIGDGLALLGRRHPAVVERMGGRIGEMEQLLRAQPRLRGIFDGLPQTLCHHDAVGANVFPDAEGTVLIDWESVGPGAVGADLASLLFASARRGDASAALVAALFDEAVAAYADGCAGVVTEEQLRRGLDAAICLRWKLAVDVAAALESGTPMRRGSAVEEPPEEALAQLLVLVELLLAAAGRALS